MIRLKPPYKDANEEFKAKYIQMKTNTLRVCLVMGAFALLIAVIYGIVYYFKNDAEPDVSTTQQAAVQKEDKYISFGSYEQDNDIDNGKEPIEWLVLEEKDGKALVISKHILDKQCFFTREISGQTWDESAIRVWMNDDFYNSAFSESEQSRILETTVKAKENPYIFILFRQSPGEDTRDKLFLLSIDEADYYFSTKEERVCHATEYVKRDDLKRIEWGLRTPGEYSGDMTFVYDSGQIGWCSGFLCEVGVRPVMWITL